MVNIMLNSNVLVHLFNFLLFVPVCTMVHSSVLVSSASIRQPRQQDSLGSLRRFLLSSVDHILRLQPPVLPQKPRLYRPQFPLCRGVSPEPPNIIKRKRFPRNCCPLIATSSFQARLFTNSLPNIMERPTIRTSTSFILLSSAPCSHFLL